MNNLKKILNVLNLSQKEFAQRTGLSEAAISHYVSGEREPALSSIQAILSVIPCSYETIWGKPKPSSKINMKEFADLHWGNPK